MLHKNKACYRTSSLLEFERHFRNNPLHVAAIHGHVAMVDFLLDAGAYWDVWDERRNSPLEVAVKTGQIRTAEYLIR